MNLDRENEGGGDSERGWGRLMEGDMRASDA